MQRTQSLLSISRAWLSLTATLETAASFETGLDLLQLDGARRAHADDVVHQFVHAVLGEPLLRQGLVGLDVVAPGADDGHVRALDGVHAVVRTAGELELELVGQGRAVHVVEEGVDDLAQPLAFVEAGLLAAGVADAGHRGAHGGAGAAEVEAQFVDLVEGLLHVLGGAALEHDVAGLAVEGDQAGAVFLPDVAELAQDVGVVVHAGRRHDAQGVELGRVLEDRLLLVVLDLGEARDDAAAVAEDADRAALPVALAGLVGVFEVAEQVDHDVLVLRQALDAGDETGPGARFQLVEIGRVVLFLSHDLSPVLRFVQYCWGRV